MELKNSIKKYLKIKDLSYIKINFIRVEEHDICIIDIEESTEPTFLYEKDDVKFFVRQGNSTGLFNVADAVKYCVTKYNNIPEILNDGSNPI